MTDRNMPWSLKGVSREARDAAKREAKAAGMTIGAWLSRAINETAAAEAADGQEEAGNGKARLNTVERMAALVAGHTLKPARRADEPDAAETSGATPAADPPKAG